MPRECGRGKTPQGRRFVNLARREIGRMRSTAEIRELLEAHSFFGEMSEGDLEALLSHAWTEHYPARQIIFTKGSPGRSMMAVVRGRIKISLPSVGGRELVLASLGVGEIFGEMALLDG